MMCCGIVIKASKNHCNISMQNIIVLKIIGLLLNTLQSIFQRLLTDQAGKKSDGVCHTAHQNIDSDREKSMYVLGTALLNDGHIYAQDSISSLDVSVFFRKHTELLIIQ